MVASRTEPFKLASRAGRASQSGQSLLEFIFTLPLMIGLAGMVIRVNTAIQTGIVNQQYSRSQTMTLTQNSANYPRLQLAALMVDKGSNQMVLGVSGNNLSEDGESTPEAPIGNIGGRKGGGSNADGEEPTLRSRVRVRNTITLCSPMMVAGGRPLIPLTKGTSSAFKVAGNVAFSENDQYDYCSTTAMEYR